MKPVPRRPLGCAGAITASGYGSGEHITFYQSAVAIAPWTRTQRQAVPTEIGRPHLPGRQTPNTGYPSIAQIAGHVPSGIFFDALSADIERLDRVNRTLALLSDAQRLATPLRPVQALVIAPSQRLVETWPPSTSTRCRGRCGCCCARSAALSLDAPPVLFTSP